MLPGDRSSNRSHPPQEDSPSIELLGRRWEAALCRLKQGQQLGVISARGPVQDPGQALGAHGQLALIVAALPRGVEACDEVIDSLVGLPLEVEQLDHGRQADLFAQLGVSLTKSMTSGPRRLR